MDCLTASEARDQLFEMIKRATIDRQQFRVTSEEGSVVILPEETYDNIIVTLELLSTPGLFDQLKSFSAFDCNSELEPMPQASSH